MEKDPLLNEWRETNTPRYIRAKEDQYLYGFDEREMWNLDKTICDFIIPRLQYFRDNQTDIEAMGQLSREQWENVLDKMINAFILAKDNNYNKDYEIGMTLFYKYFRCLWD